MFRAILSFETVLEQTVMNLELQDVTITGDDAALILQRVSKLKYTVKYIYTGSTHILYYNNIIMRAPISVSTLILSVHQMVSTIPYSLTGRKMKFL